MTSNSSLSNGIETAVSLDFEDSELDGFAAVRNKVDDAAGEATMIWIDKIPRYFKLFPVTLFIFMPTMHLIRVVNGRHSTVTKKNREWQEKLPIVVFKVEEIMYSKANSKVEYMDLETLWDRANEAINITIQRDKSIESKELLSPCVEGHGFYRGDYDAITFVQRSASGPNDIVQELAPDFDISTLGQLKKRFNKRLIGESLAVSKMVGGEDTTLTLDVKSGNMVFEPILEEGVFQFDCSVDDRIAVFPSLSFVNPEDRDMPVTSNALLITALVCQSCSSFLLMQCFSVVDSRVMLILIAKCSILVFLKNVKVVLAKIYILDI